MSQRAIMMKRKESKGEHNTISIMYFDRIEVMIYVDSDIKTSG